MMGRGYAATAGGDFEVQAVGRHKPFVVKCWSGRAAGQPEEEVCASAVDPDVIVVATVEAEPAAGDTASSMAYLRVRSVVTEGVSYWTAVDDQMENEFLRKLVK
jgi:hypothetical protein